MSRAIRTELLKIRTTRLVLGMLGLTAALNGLVAVVTCTKAGNGGGGGLTVPPLYTVGGLRMVLTSGGFGLMIAAVFGATVTSGEFRHRTATDTFLDEPNRVRVLIAKTISAGLAGLVLGFVGTVVTTGIGLGFVAARSYPVALPAGTIIRFSNGVILGSGLLAAIGAAVGSLIRNQIGSIIAVFIWAFGLEQILGGISRALAAYLPYTAATTLAGARSGEGMPQLPSGLNALPLTAVVALLAATAILMAAVSAATTVQADVA
jgi:ABC-type transport system involved in multi-copper enzyme maturation permease subunit